MKPKIFLTGSTSYIGTKFIDLYGSEFDILGVARSDPNHSLDLLDAAAVETAYKDFKPDFVLHLAADVGRDVSTSNEIVTTNPAITKTLIELALVDRTPFIFTSTEAVYGGQEQTGNYVETDEYKPRNPYGASKVVSEKLLIATDLPYLITRGHRHAGISKRYDRPKQFLDALKPLVQGGVIHSDSLKIFNPVLINNICDIFVHYIRHDSDKQITINVGSERKTTFYDFMHDIAETLDFDISHVMPDGNETGWPQNSSISVKKMRDLGYPQVNYDEMLAIIKQDTKGSVYEIATEKQQ